MPLLHFEQTGLLGLAAAVPAKAVDNRALGAELGVPNIAEVIEKIGIEERRVASAEMCSSDLCAAAAERLLDDMSVDRAEIDLLVLVSQTPDFRMPATAVTLQHRLGLPSTTMAFDLNLGCSGFVYGLSVIYGLMARPGIRHALLLNGETRTRAYSQKDKTTAFLFGDAGSAALIGRQREAGTSHFSLSSDGSRSDLLKIPAGGYRLPSSADTVAERVVDDKGNIRSLEHGRMNGPDIFSFVIREVPRDVSLVMDRAGTAKDEIDYFVFHQANAYINGYLLKKLRLDASRVPSSLTSFGNTSSVSIPLTIVSQPCGGMTGTRRVLLSGFGAGLSWGTAVITMRDCHISPLVEI